MPFVSGCSPKFAAQAQANLTTSGRYCVVVEDARPLPPAISLAEHRLAHYEQGPIGTCHEHAIKQLAEIMASRLGYDAFPVSRRLIGWVGMQSMGGGNQADGGSPTADLVGMTEKGAGVCHENVCPYTVDYNTLGQKPSQAAFDDARKAHLLAPVRVGSFDQCKKLIAAGHPVALGILWPEGWDNGQTVMKTVGPIARNPDGSPGGHALAMIGYALPGVLDDEEVYELDNWHGLLYPPLAASLAAHVPGYQPITPRRTSDFWVRRSQLGNVCQMGLAEFISGTDFSGIAKGTVTPNPGASFHGLFPA